MKRIAQVVIAVAVVIALISVVLTFFVPTHTGEIRQDLRVGDYYIIEQNNPLTLEIMRIEYRISGFTEDGLLSVTRIVDDSTPIELTLSKDTFLKAILLSDTSNYETRGYATLDTYFGSRFCTNYQSGNNQFWVGEHGIIYKQSSYGLTKVLAETSLIIS